MKASPPAKANIVRPASMGSEALGQYIADQTAGVLRRLEDLRPFYEELWKRFDKLPTGQKILGCQTRTEYCEKVLHRSIRSVQHALYGRRSLNASVSELVDGLQSEQFVEADQKRIHRELEKAVEERDRRQEKQDAARLKRLFKLAAEKWTDDDKHFVYVGLTEWQPKGGWSNQLLNRSPLKNLKAEEAKFVQDYTKELTEKHRKEEQLEEERIREQAEHEESQFDATDTVEDFLSSLRRRTVSPGVYAFLTEVVKEGFRQAAAKHHPDKGGTQQQMQDLNEANALLKQFVRSVKTTEQRRAA